MMEQGRISELVQIERREYEEELARLGEMTEQASIDKQQRDRLITVLHEHLQEANLTTMTLERKLLDLQNEKDDRCSEHSEQISELRLHTIQLEQQLDQSIAMEGRLQNDLQEAQDRATEEAALLRAQIAAEVAAQKLLHEQLTNLQTQQTAQLQEKTELEKRLQELAQTLAQQHKTTTALQEELQEANEKVAQLTLELKENAVYSHVMELEQQITSFQQQYRELSDRYEAANDRLVKQQEQLQAAEQAKRQTMAELEETRVEMDNLRGQLKTVNEYCERLSKEFTFVKKAETRMQATLSTVRAVATESERTRRGSVASARESVQEMHSSSRIAQKTDKKEQGDHYHTNGPSGGIPSSMQRMPSKAKKRGKRRASSGSIPRELIADPKGTGQTV